MTQPKTPNLRGAPSIQNQNATGSILLILGSAEIEMKTSKAVNSFKIAIPDDVLADLRHRLSHIRWSAHPDGIGWKAGTSGEYLREIVNYWENSYDWRHHEARLNQFSHFKTDLDDIGVHFIYERGKGPDPLPIILTHGYPDSFCRFLKLIPMLADPASFGGQPEDAFDVIVPDLPGYGFSDKPKQLGTIFRVHDLWARLMTEILGYKKFVAPVEIGAAR